MDRGQIISELSGRTRLPWDALQTCLADKGRTEAIFIPILSGICASKRTSPAEEAALFYGLHLLAVHRSVATRALLERFLQNHREEVDRILGDAAIGETLPRILMAIGSHEPDALWAFALHSPADWLIRDAFLKAWSYAVLEGVFPRSKAKTALKQFPEQVTLDPEDPFWISWMNSIADLGMGELEPVLKQVLLEGRVETGPFGLAPADFDDTLRRLGASTASSRNDPTWRLKAGYTPFGDATRIKYDFYSVARVAPGTSDSVSRTLMLQAAEDPASRFMNFSQAENENLPGK